MAATLWPSAKTTTSADRHQGFSTDKGSFSAMWLISRLKNWVLRRSSRFLVDKVVFSTVKVSFSAIKWVSRSIKWVFRRKVGFSLIN